MKTMYDIFPLLTEILSNIAINKTVRAYIAKAMIFLNRNFSNFKFKSTFYHVYGHAVKISQYDSKNIYPYFRLTI